MTRSLRSPRVAGRRSFARMRARGFTLVELLIAMVAGVAVATAALILSKNATRFFQHEARVSGAQLAVTLGMNRLASDIARASFLSTPNIQKDPMRCGTMAGWPGTMTSLAGIHLVKGGSALAHAGQLKQSEDNGLDPDSIVIGGAFSTTEQFAVRTVEVLPGGINVFLQTNSGAMQRANAAAAEGAENVLAIFAAGRILRIVDDVGRLEYGIIQGVTTNAAGDVIVQLAPAPAIPQKAGGNSCGLSGLSVGLLANPISRIKYDLRSLAADPQYGGLVAPPNAAPGSDAMTGDAGRTELVRVEIDTNDAEMPGTLELVAEYAVDLKFGLTVTNANGPNPVITRLPITSPPTALVYTIADDVVNVTAAPERIRAVQARLATRTRAPDRNQALDPLPDGRLYRFQLTSVLGPNFARVRTLYADIALPNQAGVQW